jgi:hypothetical protein
MGCALSWRCLPGRWDHRTRRDGAAGAAGSAGGIVDAAVMKVAFPMCEGAGCGPLHDVCGELDKNALLKTPC